MTQRNRKFLAAVLLACVLLGMMPAPAEALTSTEIEAQIKELEKKDEALTDRMDDLEKEIDLNAAEVASMVEQKNILDQQVTILYAQMDNINAQITAHKALIAEKQAALQEAEAALEVLTQQNRDRIRAMEENGRLGYWSVLSESNTFFEFLDRLSMIQEIAAEDSRRLQELQAAADAVAQVRQELVIQQAALQQKKADLEKKEDELAEKRQQAQGMLTALLAKGEEYNTYLEALEREQDALLEQIAQKQDAFDEAKYSEHMATATQPTQPSAGNGGTGNVDPSGMTWLVPCDYTVITSPFGMRNDPFTGERKMHKGVDLWCPNMYGKPIYATRGGYVSLAGWYGSGGNTVILEHDGGFKTLYMHMSYFVVNQGDYVAAGQIIGYVGDSGGVTGTHLHFEIRKDGNPVNPMEYIG